VICKYTEVNFISHSIQQLIKRLISFFLTMHKDSYVIEALLNGNPMDSVVELRVPVKVK
jgi:hypothetical protein